MNAFFKGLVGASVLLGATAVSASAQDYTWTLINMQFQDVRTFNPNSSVGTENTDATASGTLVLTYNGTDYAVKSFSINTTAGTTGATGGGATGYSMLYNRASNGSGATYAVSNTSPLESYIDIIDENDNLAFHIEWDSFGLFDEMSSNNAGAIVPLGGGLSYEQPTGLFGSVLTRYSGTGYCLTGGNQDCTGQSPGYMRLALGDTTIDPRVATPEPASMALLGAGVLGLFAARRRRAA